MYHGAGLQGRGHKLACWLCPGTTQGLFHRSLFLPLAGDPGEDPAKEILEPPASFKNLLKPVSCLLRTARPTLLSLTHDPCLHHHTHTGACVTFTGK